jgi:hypothetical protein
VQCLARTTAFSFVPKATMKKPARQTDHKLELELQRARELVDQNHQEARKMLIRAMAISEVSRKRVIASMTFPA